MTQWFTETGNEDFAIRQFCAARAAQETAPEEDFEIWPNVFDDMPQLSSTEVDEIIDAFFNVECYEKDNAEKSEEEDGILAVDREDSLEDASVADDPMIVEGEELRGLISTADCEVYSPMNVDQGLQLVHMLLACAEAVSCRDAHLAGAILRQIWPCVDQWGDSLQRVLHCFASGLDLRLAFLRNVSANGALAERDTGVPVATREERAEAFALLHQMTPYVAFGFLSANDAICRAGRGKESLHIVDLGMEHTLQWSSLVRTLASRGKDEVKSIRITGVIGDQDPLELESNVERLQDEAISLGICLEVNLITEQALPVSLTHENLDLKEGETLFVNSIMHLHKHVKESRGSLKTILQAIKTLSPTLVTVVEQDANHNGPFFLGRFLEALHYYSAIFDSLDASLPRNNSDRAKIEKLHFAEEIRNVVAYEGADRVERHERADQWRRQLGRAGFRGVGLKWLEEGRRMVGEYGCDGYSVESEKGCLKLGWKGRPILWASAWQLHNVCSC